jgi:hypothetical protein
VKKILNYLFAWLTKGHQQTYSTIDYWKRIEHVEEKTNHPSNDNWRYGIRR